MKKALRLFVDVLLIILAIFGGLLSYLVVYENLHIVRVVSDSMAPSIHRGDALVFRAQPTINIEQGQILLLPLADGSGASYVHRVIEKKQQPNSSVEVRTKGDANPEIDNWRITITSSEVPVYVASLPTRHLPLIAAGKWGGVALLSALFMICVSLIWPIARSRKREIADSFE
jgi:signal peptidase